MKPRTLLHEDWSKKYANILLNSAYKGNVTKVRVLGFNNDYRITINRIGNIMKPQSASTSKVAVSLLILTVVMAALFIKPTVQYVEAGNDEVNQSIGDSGEIGQEEESEQVELIEEEKLKPGQRRISNKTPGTGGQFVQSYQEVLDENGDFVKCIINHSEDGIDNTDK